MHSPIMTKSTMEKVAMVPTVALQPLPCTTASANKPLYRCPTHPTNLSTMILVAMATDMARLMENENNSIGESIKSFSLMKQKLIIQFHPTDNIRTLTETNNSKHHTLIALTHYHARWSSHITKWPAITLKIDEIVAVKIPMEAIKIITIVKRQNAPMEPTHQTSISCLPKENIQERSLEFMLTTIRTQNNFSPW